MRLAMIACLFLTSARVDVVRELRPLNEVREVWESPTDGQTRKLGEKFVLVRHGALIRGFNVLPVPEMYTSGNFIDVLGVLRADDSFALVGENGFVWKGRFTRVDVIEGTKSVLHDAGNSAFPFRLEFVREAAMNDFPARLPVTYPDWEEFWSHFKTAIQKHDDAAIMKFMGRPFLLENALIHSDVEVPRKMNWSEVLRVTSDGQVMDRKSPLGKQMRFIVEKLACTKCSFGVTLAFIQDSDKQWRWTGVTYPGD